MHLRETDPGKSLDTMLQWEQMPRFWLVSLGMRWSEGSAWRDRTYRIHLWLLQAGLGVKRKWFFQQEV